MEGQTLILPAHKLSARDKEILAGIGPWSYRTYPVRAGETLDVSPRQLAVPTAPTRPKLNRAASWSSTYCKYCTVEHAAVVTTHGCSEVMGTAQQAISNLIAGSKG